MKLNLSFLKTLWHKIWLGLNSKIPIFWTLLLTLMTFFLANYPNWGTYLSSQGINDPFKRPIERLLGKVKDAENQTKLDSSLLSKDEELYRDCLTQHYGDFEYFPDIPKYIEISQENKKKTRLSLMLEMKQDLSNNLLHGFNSLSQVDKSGRLKKSVDDFREIYSHLSYSYMPCQKQIFNKKVQKFLNDFEFNFDLKISMTREWDGFEGSGMYLHYATLLLKEYDQLILTTLNEQEYLDSPEFKVFKKKWDSIRVDPYES